MRQFRKERSRNNREERTYAAVAVKISTLELEDERMTKPIAKRAVKSAMRPRIRLILWTLARMLMATVGRRQATTVVTIEVQRTIHAPVYTSRFSAKLLFEEALLLPDAAELIDVGVKGGLPSESESDFSKEEGDFVSGFWCFLENSLCQIQMRPWQNQTIAFQIGRR